MFAYFKGGAKHTKDGGLINVIRHGRFKFEQKKGRPYVKSQHEDLIDLDGWYVLVVGDNIRGIPAKVVDERIHGDWVTRRVVWDKIIFLSYPNWLESLKKQVYGGNNGS